jgi:radical SAM-linked protein
MTAGDGSTGLCGQPVARPVGRSRVAVELAIEGDLRYLSHHDELRMLARALVRARWPLAYSQGYNPLPRIVLPLPRNVGTATTCQWALIDLCAPRDPRGLYETLAAALPAGCNLRRVVAPAPRAIPHPRAVSYRVELSSAEAGQIRRWIQALLASGDVTLTRHYGPNKPDRRVNIRPYIEDIVWDGGCLHMRLAHVQQRSARPVEILTALGLATGEYNHGIRRTEVEWDVELTGPTQWPAAPERNEFGQEEEENGNRPSGQEDAQEQTS